MITKRRHLSDLFGANLPELSLLQRCWRDVENVESKSWEERA